MKIFCLFARQYWEHKSSPVRRHVIQALLRHPEIRGVVSGQGWDDYNEQQSLKMNVDRLLPGCDVILYYKPYGNPKLGIPPIIAPQDVDALRVVRLHEFWWSEDLQMIELMHGNIDLALCTHENDLDRVREHGVDAEHLPQTADSRLFRCYEPLEKRPINALLTGSTAKTHYPLRSKLHGMVTAGMIDGVIRNHPPSWARNLAENERQVDDYAKQLGMAKIALCCSSKWKYALGKVVEAMQSGCIVACDMPDDARFQRTLGRYILPIDTAEPDAIPARINMSLSMLGSMQNIASAGQRVALEEYSHDRYVEWLLKTCRSYLAKRAVSAENA